MLSRLWNAAFRVWYWYVSSADKNSEIVFMNYGFSRSGFDGIPDSIPETEHVYAQLYKYVTSNTTIEGKRLLEVGSGRGGGLSFINRTLRPSKATGLDLCGKAIEFCTEHYRDEGITFIQGNAEDLSFPDNSFDVVLNVESSHRYDNIDKFISEAYRVLIPGGHFLLSDFRKASKIGLLKTTIERAGFQIVISEFITSDVLEALRLSTPSRKRVIRKLAPAIVQGLGQHFAATEGTPTYNKFQSREWEYFAFVMRKKNADCI